MQSNRFTRVAAVAGLGIWMTTVGCANDHSRAENGTGAGGATGGETGAGGQVTASGGRVGSGGSTTGDGGRVGSGGSTTGSGGRVGSGGNGGSIATGGAGSGTGGTTSATNCGSATLDPNPFGCAFAFGTDNGGNVSQLSYLQFVSNWVGANVRADGTFPTCTGCTWLSGQVASTSLIPVYYAYFIGFYGHINGLPDGNVGGPPNLTTGGANLIRNNRAKIIQMYAWYAQQTALAWKTKPLLWLLEGDFVQYSGTSQTNPLTYAELGQLTADIVCAIKSNMPNAVVAIDHSTWNPDDVTKGFWGAMKNVNYDLVWTTGMATATGFFDNTTTATSYNGKTAKYSYLHQLTGKTIFVDTSFGASAMGDTWSNATAATLNARIADGVIAANVTTAPSNYASAVAALKPSLNVVCP